MRKIPTVTLRAKYSGKKGYLLFLDIYYDQNHRLKPGLNLYVSKDYTKGGRVLKKDQAAWLAAQEYRNREYERLVTQGLSLENANIRDHSFVDHFVRVVKQKDNDSYRGALYQLKRFLKSQGMKDITIAQITKPVLDSLRSYLLENLSENTAKQYLGRYSIAWKELPGSLPNPFKQVRAIKAKREKLPGFLTEEQISQLAKTECSEIKEIDKLAFLFACETGLRISDVRRLTWADHIKDKSIRIKMQKGGREVEIPKHENVNAILSKLDRNTELVFEGMTKNTTINKALREWAKAAGLKLDFSLSFHNSRHSFISNLARKGANIVTVSKIVGHSDLRMTMRYYQEILEDKENAVNLFDKRDY